MARGKESIFRTIGASNHTAQEREINDYYATDPNAIDYLLMEEEFSNNIWEPACGVGNMSKRLKEYGYNVLSTDLIMRDNYADKLIDFLQEDVKEYDGDIITNPPYSLACEFIEKSLSIIKPNHKVAMFLKLTALEGQSRYNRIYKNNPPRTIYVFIRRIECAKNNVFQGTSAVCYAWFVWQKGFKGLPTIKWI